MENLVTGKEDNKVEKTFDFQSRLPPLPLPNLDETCDRYLTSVRPLVTEEEYIETERKTNKFKDGIGKVLQKKLEKISKDSRNWVADMWYGGYLDYRGPLPAISNTAGGVLPAYSFDQAEHGSQYKRAALWCYFLLEEFLKIIRQEIPLQKLGRKYPMDMTQYLDFFCAGRIPGEKRDTQVHHINYLIKRDGTMEISCNIRHIIVLMRGRIFKVKVVDNDGKILVPPSLERQFLNIVDLCEESGDGHAIGSLTAADRDTYFRAYQHLCMLDKQNKMNINLINEAIFGFAFDDVETFGLQDSLEHAMLGDCTNRWFDKNLIGISGTTGLIGSNNDHIHYDGNIGTQVLKNIKDKLRTVEFKWTEAPVPQETSEPVELQFVVDEHIKRIIQETQTKHHKLMSDIEVIDKPIKGFGKSFTKSHGISPDTFVQMAIQLAYYRLHRKVVATYESATTRIYYQGRTETVRSCICESKAWVESMCNGNVDRESSRELFWKAVKNHDKLMLDATMGNGIDRHLFALKTIAEKEGIEKPDIFIDKAWKLSGGDANFLISTSLAGFHELHGSIAPMMYDGYGAFYTIDNEWVYISVSTWRASTESNCSAFYESIVKAFHSIKDLIGEESKL